MKEEEEEGERQAGRVFITLHRLTFSARRRRRAFLEGWEDRVPSEKGEARMAMTSFRSQNPNVPRFVRQCEHPS